MPELKRSEPRERVSIDFSESPSMTEQCHASEVKIQAIMKKYERTGIVTHTNKYQGTYCDMVGAPDYHEAQNIIAEAKSMFETVPSRIRADFNNDPAQYIAFMQDPANREQIEAYGLDASHLPVSETCGEPRTQDQNPLKKPSPEESEAPAAT